jgi:PPK2 family polyphosphate:nucleotide phosphotransferase
LIAAGVRWTLQPMKLAKLLNHIRIDKPRKFRLGDRDPSDTHGIDVDKDKAQARLDHDVARLTDLQERLYAQDRWAVLIILQGMDASGKDGVVKHVMAGINPQGCDVHSFKAPSAEELNHDFLWRSVCRLPERGRIGIFNRSYYEEVLVARVHPDILARQRLPRQLADKHIWQRRFADICGFERGLSHNGVLVLKFFLHISREEQRQRLLARLQEPAKRWKFSMNDIAERRRWDDYMAAYEEMICATSHAAAPWHVVPSDHKPVARLLVAGVVVDALEKLDLSFPTVRGKALDELKQVERALASEKPRRKPRGK